MIGRITANQTTRNFLADLHQTNRALEKAQREVSTGKRVTTPADDPLGISQALRLRQEGAGIAAFRSNLADSLTWMGTTDASLDSMTQVIARARELAVQGANGALSASGRATLAEEVDALRAQALEIANAQVAGRHLFAGTATQTVPFDAAGVYLGNTGGLLREVDAGSTLTVNITGDRLAGPGGGVLDLFATLDALATDLGASSTPGIQGALGSLDAHLGSVNALRGELAGKINRLELAASRFSLNEIANTDQLSSIENVDMAVAITELKTRESLYRSSLGVGGRVLQPSLLDFLR